MKKLVITAALYVNNTADLRDSDRLDAESCRAIGEAVSGLCDAGAAVIHLYVGYSDAGDAADGSIYIRKLTDSIYERCPEVIIVPELFGHGSRDYELAAATVRNEPELAVLNCDIDNISHDADEAEEQIRRLGNAMLDNGVRPLIKCMDKGMVDTAIRMYREGWMSDPLLFLFVLGTKGGMDATIDNLMYLKNSIPVNSRWSVGCCGKDYIDMAAAAMLMGGNISAGDDRCGTNELEERIRQIAQLARMTGRKIASPAEARAIMNLNLKYRRVIDEHLL